jgi:ubiquinone/menaquinone biosynthesis C-methylase UbiE
LSYSIFVLNNVDEIENTITETARTLKTNGKFYFVTAHPAYVLSLYLYEKYTRKPNEKLTVLKDYFSSFATHYVLAIAGNTSAFYHRPMQYYINLLIKNGFKITKFEELKVTEKVIKQFPKYEEVRNIPKFLLIESIKEPLDKSSEF